jgi:uncharacterized membrane protein
MSPQSSVLDAEATPLRARALVRAGLLDADKLDDALDQIRGRPEDVPATVRALLLTVGITLLACGVAFFVAANWSAIAAHGRMALVALGIVLCSGIALHVGARTRGGQASITLAGLLIGPLLMLYGQTYQTGADAWELFAAWTLLLAPFAFVTRALGLSLIGLMLVHLTVPLFMSQQLGFAVDADGALAAGVMLAVVDVIALACLELSLQRWRVRDREGPRAVALLGALVAFAAGTVAIVEDRTGGAWRTAAFIAAVAYAGVLLTSGWMRKRPDLFFTAVGAFLGAALFLVGVGRVLFEDLHFQTGGLFVQGFLVLTVVGALTRTLLHLHRTGRYDAEEEP